MAVDYYARRNRVGGGGRNYDRIELNSKASTISSHHNSDISTGGIMQKRKHVTFYTPKTKFEKKKERQLWEDALFEEAVKGNNKSKPMYVYA